MDQAQYKASTDRTDSKLRYAVIHFEELEGVDRRGEDFDRSHQESFLFHLHGVRDAFLQELNIKFDCGLPIHQVDKKRLNNVLGKKEIESKALAKLNELESDEDSWLTCINEMRHHSPHRNSIPRVYHVGGENDGDVYLTNTRNGRVIEEDYIVLFEQWLKKMGDLITELRKL